MPPDDDDVQFWLRNRIEKARKRRATGKPIQTAFAFGYQQAADDDDSEDTDLDAASDLRRLDERQRRFQEGDYLVDEDGQSIGAISAAEVIPAYDAGRRNARQGSEDDEHPFNQQRSNQILPGGPQTNGRAGSAFRNAQ